MNYDRHLLAEPWEGYELIDSGENMKLERFGEALLARPETQALWAKRHPERWGEARAIFSSRGEGAGSWRVDAPLPVPWTVARGQLRLIARLTGFKHVGIFPEQAPNWAWIGERVAALGTRGAAAPRVLNLFAYTGASTIAAARSGAQVTHVDASKQSLYWARENARASGAREDAIRWIFDDARAFARREARRGEKYDGIILDPPAFGRGAKGEVWKIEEDLPALLAVLKGLLAEASGSFFLISGYAAGYAARSLAQAVESVFGNTGGESGELHIAEKDSGRIVPAGIYARFVRE